MIIPILIGFGLLAAFIISSRGPKKDSWVVGLLIIMLAFALIIWGMIPWAIGFRESIYR